MGREEKSKSLAWKLRWVAVLYLAEGLPFGFAIDTLPVYFRVHGVSLAAIGALSLLALPWSLKVLWSPLVDRSPNYRRWISGSRSSWVRRSAGSGVSWIMRRVFSIRSPVAGWLESQAGGWPPFSRSMVSKKVTRPSGS